MRSSPRKASGRYSKHRDLTWNFWRMRSGDWRAANSMTWMPRLGFSSRTCSTPPLLPGRYFWMNERVDELIPPLIPGRRIHREFERLISESRIRHNGCSWSALCRARLVDQAD